MELSTHQLSFPFVGTPWKKEVKEFLTTAEELLIEGLISRDEVAGLEAVASRFKLAIPKYYADLIDKEDLNCPIRLQALPSLKELENLKNWKADPLEDLQHRPVSRLTHRYRNRVLFHLTANCSMYCRFCFRKSLLNEDLELFQGQANEALFYLMSHPEIEEVIFSGGDPFMWGDEALGDLLTKLNGLQHIQRLRFHTRVPVTFPARIHSNLLDALDRSLKPLVVVTHFNHPKELTEEAARSLAFLKEKTQALLNQTVLLRKVNDNAAVLKQLSEGLFDFGVLPYYLHHPDPALGTEHFDVSLEEGQRIYKELRANLSGYLVPRYVRDNIDIPYKETL